MKLNIRGCLVIFTLLVSLLSIQAQSLSAPDAEAKTTDTAAKAASETAALSSEEEKAKASEFLEIPSSFLGFSLGMSLEEAKAALQKESLFSYAGEPDVSMLPSKKETLIDVHGPSYIKRASFQFVNDFLYVMIFHLDTSKIDHYSLYSSMSKKYGKPSSVSPQEISWGTRSLRVSIERPLSVKYIDLESYAEISNQSLSDKSFREMRREQFIQSF